MDATTPEHLQKASSPLTPADIKSIFVGLMLAMLLSALDQTIVATAMPTIGRDLGDVEHLPWIVTAYLLASTAATPLYGKFSDMHGRRGTLLFGIAVFIVGSIACAAAPSMLVLILARFLQGLGGGGLVALAQTIVADMVTPRERGRYQVYFGAVFACASLAGPLLGGVLSESIGWSSIFWINIPLGVLAFWLTNDRLKKLPLHGRKHRLDVLGAALMTGATVSLMLALSWGGVRYPWGSLPIGATLATSVALWIAFSARLRTATEPLIPIAVLKDKVVGFAIAASALAMGTYIGLAIFVPIYFEAALGMSARQSGMALIPLMVGIVVGSTLSGRSMARLQHYKLIPLVGLAVALLSVTAIAITTGRLPFWTFELMLAVGSLGIGTLMPIATVSMQNAVLPGYLGTATAGMNFARQLTGAIIVAIFGSLALGGSHGDAGSVTLETLGAAGGNPALFGTFRLVFAAAALGLAGSYLCFILMEERPLRDRRPLREAVVE